MEKIISLQKKKLLNLFTSFTQIKKTSFSYLLLGLSITTLIVYASPEGHDTPVAEVKQSEQIVVRKAGDTDPDAISQEGLGSFYGEIISKDIASVHSSREGVITSWNVSIGDRVSAGTILGYVTVTGVSPEQQMQLAEQQANVLKAKLDLETVNKITAETESVFGKITNSLKSVADKQREIYDGTNGAVTSTYLTELQAIQARQASLENKLQDFSNTALNEIYPLVSQYGQSPSNSGYSETSLNADLGNRNSSLRNIYASLIKQFATKVTSRTVTDQDVRNFLNKTTDVIEATLPTGSIDTGKIITSIKDLQTELRDISNELSQSAIDKASKERERSQIDIELAKSLAEFDNDLNLKKLEQTTANERAKNEAKGAELLAQNLSISAGGVVPVLASKSGIVASIEKNVGEYVSVADQIGLISNQNPVKIVRFTIPTSWREVKSGDILSLIWKADFSPGSAVITGISPIINKNGGHQAEAVLSKDTVFPVGSSVRLIPENSKKGVFINSKAVVFDNLTPFVWLVTENETIRKQEIQVGRQLGEYVEVISGLSKGFGYLVILDPTINLENGQNIADVISGKDEAIIESESKLDAANASTTPTVQNESVPHEH